MLKRYDPFAVLALFAVPGAAAMVFFYAPLERTMGVVQKIFYFHLGLAAAAFLSFFVACVAGILYLVKRQRAWDERGAAAVEIGVLFTTLVLLTGSIWGRPIWNTWWTWDPRLTTSLILWFIFAACLILRSAVEQEEKRAVFCAVMAIVGFVDVPVVFLSARLWRSIHPTVIRSEGIALEPPMLITLAVSLTAMLILWAALFRLRCNMQRQENALLDLQQQLQR
ncbi:ResC/HemX-like cytochrome c biogenesis membrane protein [Desulfuromonas sp. DDH964]|uniref:cytochrome c biogenesis protein n=1 Tax=Desulfuromonas sp. DDH964 TaxID=1823759 RepID=UPI00078CEA52|nr:cytochrome c biogenesis protein CcsA [Desulfuromonas sp. DDH964]AMV70632.1 ResC/HemX-like cytochrome c biogenesis membrane protein [Desulfuromonas sp. DDH964]